MAHQAEIHRSAVGGYFIGPWPIQRIICLKKAAASGHNHNRQQQNDNIRKNEDVTLTKYNWQCEAFAAIEPFSKFRDL
jgi:hypothetical protein